MSNSALLDAYRRDGVVRCRGVFDAGELTEIRQAFDAYQTRAVASLPESDYTLEPDGTSVRNFWRMHEHEPFFRALAERPALVDLVAPLVNGQVVVMAVESFHKTARGGAPGPPHQGQAHLFPLPAGSFNRWGGLRPPSQRRIAEV